MLFKRVTTALLGVPVFLYVIYIDGMALGLAAAILAIIAATEYIRVLDHARIPVNAPVLYLAAFVLPILAVPVGLLSLLAFVPAAFALTHLSGLLTIIGGGNSSHSTLAQQVSWTTTGVVYVCVFWAMFPLVRLQGLPWVYLLLATTWLTDTGAYFVGYAFRGPKFIPRISPNKTWSGAFGGVVCGTAGAVAVNAIWPIADPAVIAVVGLLGAVAAQVGDLWVSLLKRFGGVKDAGTLLPGHGGILDRFDSFLFVVPVIYAASRFLSR